MKAGRKPGAPHLKTLSGTYRADRHANIVELGPEGTREGPTKPNYLSKEAGAVWEEELARVVGCGATDADSSFFAAYCVLQAALRSAHLAGELPKAALLTELRRHAEMLGIASLKSRLGRGASAPAAEKKDAPFKIRKP